ncbi:MAG: DNA methylase [Iphinoe sp. HA4291-MV1]|jgi:site-specific DNA-methyltransferase (adenine-specific)|nr:DNA methylase [Iphinoe sp. HA4291-MV1]
MNSHFSPIFDACGKPGKLHNRLVHGDCIPVMQSLPSASMDLIVTDPPYLVNYTSRDGRSIQNDDNDAWLLPAFQEMYRMLKDNSFCISFYGWHKIDRFMQTWKRVGFRPVGHFTFVKNYASGESFTQFSHENAYLLIKGRPERPATAPRDVMPWKYTGNTLHPTQKPVKILTQLIEAYSVPGGLVLDPFSGSASTAVAARARGRAFFAIEKDPQYYNIAKNRLFSNA